MKNILNKLDRYFQRQWRLGVLDLEKGLRVVAPMPAYIAYLKAQNAHGSHILMQPIEPSVYLLADDLTWETVCMHHRIHNTTWRPGRMVVETSPGNFQVWIHSKRSLSVNEKCFWLKKLRSDPAAHPQNRWGRCPGFRNRKEKYRSLDGQYPLSRLIWIDWITRADIPPVLTNAVPPRQNILSLHSPRGAVCHQRIISRLDYQRGNESQTDFAYALALARRGYTDQNIRERLLAERICWNNHRGEMKRNLYLDRTIRRARQIVQMTPKAQTPSPKT